MVTILLFAYMEIGTILIATAPVSQLADEFLEHA